MRDVFCIVMLSLPAFILIMWARDIIDLRKRNELEFYNNSLEGRITRAREIADYRIGEYMTDIYNRDEILNVLQYEDTLGMQLFVRDWICNPHRSIEQCVNRLDK